MFKLKELSYQKSILEGRAASKQEQFDFILDVVEMQHQVQLLLPQAFRDQSLAYLLVVGGPRDLETDQVDVHRYYLPVMYRRSAFARRPILPNITTIRVVGDRQSFFITVTHSKNICTPYPVHDVPIASFDLLHPEPVDFACLERSVVDEAVPHGIAVFADDFEAGLQFDDAEVVPVGIVEEGVDFQGGKLGQEHLNVFLEDGHIFPLHLVFLDQAADFEFLAFILQEQVFLVSLDLSDLFLQDVDGLFVLLVTSHQLFDLVIFQRCLFLEFPAQVLQFELDEFWLFDLPLFHFDFDEFLLEFGGIEPHLETDGRVLGDDNFWKEFHECVEEFFWSFEAEVELVFFFQVLVVDFGSVEFVTEFMFEFD